VPPGRAYVSGLASVLELEPRCQRAEAHDRHYVGIQFRVACPGKYETELVDPATKVREALHGATSTIGDLALFAALEAVLDMHAPLIHQAYGVICLHCSGWGSTEVELHPMNREADYPCPTIRKVAEQIA
jgi:hypothetical protein